MIWREKQEEYPSYADLGASCTPACGAEKVWATWVGISG